ncbi:MAG: winged helix-turn-helix domain-containing protein [Infirmifilum sp.]
MIVSDEMRENATVEELAEVLQVLANPVRLKMLALIAVRPRHAYELSKLLGLSYPLTHLHVSLLERMGFIKGETVQGPRPKKVYSLSGFSITISPELLRKLGEALEGK